MRRRWYSRQNTRAMIGLLAPKAATAPSPAVPANRIATRAWLFSTFSEPVAQNPTGLPAAIFHGYSRVAPLALEAIEDQRASADPAQGVSISGGGRWPSVPGRRPPLAPPTSGRKA